MLKRTNEILNYLYLFRFLTRNQIQTLLNHKYFNRIIVWLNQLTNNGYLRKYYNPRTVTIPALYSLGLKSRTYLRKNNNPDINLKLLDRIWKEHKLSQEFREHCLFIADCYLSLLKSCKNNNSKLHFYTKTQLHGMRYLILPHPDAYIAIEEISKEIHRYFLDVFATMPARMLLRKRVRQYLEYFDENIWQEQTGHLFPKIIMITPDERSKNYLYRFIQTILEDEPDLEFYLGIREIVKENGLNSNTLRKVEELN